MPAPKRNEIPDKERWTFIQRFPDITTELKPLARNLRDKDGQSYEPLKADILDFLGTSVADRTQKWSDLWIIIMQTLGLAYTTPKDSLLHTTALGKYLADTSDPVEAFFTYWALKFQFPWAQLKHREWKIANKRVQPFVFLLRHLLTIFDDRLAARDAPFSHTYLTYEEVVLILMKSDKTDNTTVSQNAHTILDNRANTFNYSSLHVPGFDLVKDQFANRTRQYFEKCGLLTFDTATERVSIDTWSQLLRIIAFLSYSTPPFEVTTDEQTRITLFENAFSKLNPHPSHLYKAISSFSSIPNMSPLSFNLTKFVSENLSNQGYSYTEEFVEAFLLSLKTKPFLILSGISGTGKTALPKAIMRMIGNDNCKPIAVAPDWTDNTDMLGYFNVENEFIIGEFTILVEEAAKNRHVPYFVILDEMNLARVEYYFAQVLSVLESRTYNAADDDVEYEDFLFNKAMRDRLRHSKDNSHLAQLKIPSNLYLIGTVNIDETTHPFSKKVLDRANVLETTDVDLMQGVVPPASPPPVHHIPSLNRLFKGNITNLAELKQAWPLNRALSLPIEDTLKEWVKKLTEFNEILSTSRMNFGYRVRDEVCIYLYHAANLDPAAISAAAASTPDWWHKYFDQQLVQKILTRFSGEQNQVEVHIEKLFNLCVQGGPHDQDKIIGFDLTGSGVLFPKAALKLQRMLREVVTEDRPSTSFWTV